MKFKSVLLDLTNYSTYVMMRKQGITAKTLEYFSGSTELEKQYKNELSPDEYGQALIDAQTCRSRGLIQ